MATLTITTSGADDTRIAVAFGAKLGLAGNANASQIKADVISYIRTVVADQERLADMIAFSQSTTPIAPT